MISPLIQYFRVKDQWDPKNLQRSIVSWKLQVSLIYIATIQNQQIVVLHYNVTSDPLMFQPYVYRWLSLNLKKAL